MSINKKCKNNFELWRNGKFNVKVFIRLSLKKKIIILFYFCKILVICNILVINFRWKYMYR